MRCDVIRNRLPGSGEQLCAVRLEWHGSIIQPTSPSRKIRVTMDEAAPQGRGVALICDNAIRRIPG